MKKWMKKLVISSGAIALVGTGTGVLMNTTQNTKIKNTDPNRSDRFIYKSIAAAAANRTYILRLSSNSVKALLKETDPYINPTWKGNAVFTYLLQSWSKTNDWDTDCRLQLYDYLNAANDYNSVNLLLRNKNPYTWMGGFNINSFMALLNSHAKSSTTMTLSIYVDYVFLGHNKYGASFF